MRKRLVGIWEGPEVSRDSPTGAAEQVGIHSIDASLFVVSAHVGTATAVIDFEKGPAAFDLFALGLCMFREW